MDNVQLQYLFIRVLEACNAGCNMCAFAWSKDGYRVDAAEMQLMLERARDEGVRFVRFTGGEPLVHRSLEELIALVRAFGMKCSVITNGALLAQKITRLVDAGLGQVIVSIDGANARTHDEIRAVPGLFARAVEGLGRAVDSDVHCRVNTVCGPCNFREMPALQTMLTELGVHQWELSSLKLGRALDYSADDVAELDRVVEDLYVRARRLGRLVPMGKVWCGETSEERQRYLQTGVPPRPDGVCHVVERVRYYDARLGRLYPCSLLPHRPDAEAAADSVGVSQFTLTSPRMQAVAARFYGNGPMMCSGCSATAAGYSNRIEGGDIDENEWAY